MTAPRFMERVRTVARVRHLSPRAERAYSGWIVRFIRLHGTGHPKELGAVEARSYLSHLAVDRRVSTSTQNQALAALVFLYRDVLEQELGPLGPVTKAGRGKRPEIRWYSPVCGGGTSSSVGCCTARGSGSWKACACG